MADRLFIVIPAYNEQDNIKQVVNDWYPIVEKFGTDSRLVVIDDGSRDTTLSQNQLLNYGNGQTKDSKFNTEGFYCTRGMSYVYINVDMASDHNICMPKESYLPISEYKIKTEPQLCHKKYCSLCGDISLARCKEDIDF